MQLAIDFGTCNSSAALMLDGIPKPVKEPLKLGYSFPSSVFITNQGEVLVGQSAENSRQRDPQRYRREFKRDLGSPDPYTLGDRQLLPEELVSEVIHKLKLEAEKVSQGWGEPSLTNAVITIPATYQFYKRELMNEACIKAGLTHIDLLEEPIAAAIYYADRQQVREGDIILVYDLGGGTFDATLIQKQESSYQILAMPKGLATCGGTDFDRQIYQHLKKHCSDSLRQQLDGPTAWLARAIVSDLCRDLKHQLSEEPEASVYIPIGLGTVETYSLNRETFNGMIAPLIDETVDCCDQIVRSAGIQWNQISQILLVGGSCRIPYVQETIGRKLGHSLLLVDEPELAVCLGAAIYSSTLEAPIQASSESALVSPPVSPTQTSESFAPPLPEPTPQISAEEQIAEQVAHHLTQGKQKLEATQYTGAIAEFYQAIQLDSTCAEAFANRGKANLQLQNYQQAIEDCDRAIELKLSVAETYYVRGVAYFSLNNLSQAIRELNCAINLNPNFAAAFTKRGAAQLGLKNYEKAINDFTHAIEIDSGVAEAHRERIQAYTQRAASQLATKNYEFAINDCAKAIELDPQATEAYCIRAEAYANSGQVKQAIVDCDHLIQVAPQVARIHHIMGIVYSKSGDFPKAIAEYSQAIQLDPKMADAYCDRAYIYMKSRNQQAVTDCNQAIQLNPQLAKAYAVRGIISSFSGDDNQALADFNQAIQLDHKESLAYVYRGFHLFVNKLANTPQPDLELCKPILADCNKALQLQPSLAEAYMLRGIVQGGLKQFAEAADALGQAINLFSSSSIYQSPFDKSWLGMSYSARGMLQTELGHYECAITDWSRAIQLEPELVAAGFPSSAPYFERANMRQRLGDYKGAAEDYEQVLKANPASAEALQGRQSALYTAEKYAQININYPKLEHFLQAKDWKRASDQTIHIVEAVAEYWYLNLADLEKFPCDVLWHLDELWIKYSNGLFGFSIQKKTWNQVEGNAEAFGEQVGWRFNNTWGQREWWFRKNGTPIINFTPTAPIGHLPVIKVQSNINYPEFLKLLFSKLFKDSLNLKV